MTRGRSRDKDNVWRYDKDKNVFEEEICVNLMFWEYENIFRVKDSFITDKAAKKN